MNIPEGLSFISPVQVGRDEQMRLALQHIRQAQFGQGRVLLLTGEAGIGKSRFVAHLTQLLRDLHPPWRILQGRCFETDQTVPYAPLLDLFRQYIDQLLPAQIVDEFSALAADLLPIFPDLKRQLPDIISQPIVDPQQSHRQLHQSMATWFSQRAHAQPTLLVVEDMHWCDDASLDFLSYLTRSVRQTPLCLLLTYRPDEASLMLERFLDTVNRERLATGLPLQRLPYGETAHLLQAILRLENLPRRDFVDALHSLTEGNPFFIEEVLKSLFAEGGLFLFDGRWDGKALDELKIPRSVHMAVQRRIANLSAAARRLLTVAAVAGRRFDFDLLRHLTASDEHTLVGLIRELMAAQLVIEESDDVFVFRHALTRQAIYSDLLARERRQWHSAIGGAMEQLYGGDATLERHLIDIAHHYYEAHDWRKALEFAERAGKRARQMYSPLAAIEQFNRAIDAAQFLKQAPAPALYRERGQLYEQIGEFDMARRDYTAALDTARQLNQLRDQWQSLLNLGFLWMARDFYQCGMFLEQAIQLARDMNDPATLGYSLNRVGNLYANLEQPVIAHAYHTEALTIFEQLHNQAGIAASTDLLGLASLMRGDHVTAQSLFERVIPLFEALNDQIGLAQALVYLAMFGGNYIMSTGYCPPQPRDLTLQYAQRALKIIHDIEWEVGKAGIPMYVALLAGARGEYDLALDSASLALTTADRIDHKLYHASGHMSIGHLYYDLLDLPAAEAHLIEALQLATEVNSRFMINAISGFLASLYRLRNNATRGRVVLSSLLDLDSPICTATTQSQRILWAGRVELALLEGDFGLALNVVDQLIDSAPRADRSQRIIPHLWLLRAEALDGLGQTDNALTHLDAANGMVERMVLPALRRRILQTTAGVLLRNARRAAAELIIEALHDQIDTTAIKINNPDLRQTFVLAARATAPQRSAPTARQATRAQFDGLTVREREIAIMVAEGKTNREIAGTLTLSQRTVDTHLSSILSKLGFSSRAQVARWAVEKGLVT